MSNTISKKVIYTFHNQPSKKKTLLKLIWGCCFENDGWDFLAFF